MTDRDSDRKTLPELITKLDAGEFELYSFVENRCYLDGGSMFGVIPKVLWSKLIQCDENNLVPLDTNLLFVKAHGKRILVECGIGDMLTDIERKVYTCYTPSRMDDCLSRLGVTPDMIDYVILTHLHLDHVGGAVVADRDGNPSPRFTNARHVIRQEEWDDAMNPDDRSKVSYPADRLRCLEDSGLIDFVDADTEVLPNIWVIRTGGHTRGHQIVTMSSGNRTVVFCGDLFPIVGVLRPTYIAAADLFPLKTLEHKKKLLSEVIEKNWIVAFDHDLEYKFATLKRGGRGVVPKKVGDPFLAALRSCKDNINESRKATG